MSFGMELLGIAASSGLGRILGGVSQDDRETLVAKKNFEKQEEFAKHGIRWRVEDAKAAGLHPLYALGANTASFSPVHVGARQPSAGAEFAAQMGQGLVSAGLRAATRDERADVLANLQVKSAELGVQNQELQNQLLGSQIARMNANPTVSLPSNSDMPLLTGQGNAFPSSSGGNAYVQEKPLERIHSSPGVPAQEVGTVADYGFARTGTGLAIVPSKDVKERIEDQFIPEIMWSARNQFVGPYTGAVKAPDPRHYPPPKGSTHWVWNPLANEFQGNNYDSYSKRFKEYWNERPWKK